MWLGVLAAASAAHGQYALDGSLSTSGRINQRRPAPALQHDVYSLNRNTGTMVYNRASAFNDPTYSIHQRYTQDRFQNFTPAGVSTGAQHANRSAATGSPGRPRRDPAPVSNRPPVHTRPATVGATPSGGVQTSSTGVGGTRPRSYSSAWTVPSESFISAERFRDLTEDDRGRGAGLSGSGYSAVQSQDAPPEPAITRRRRYSVADDDLWSWR